MQKRVKRGFIFGLCLSEISLMVLMSFAIAFMLAQSLGVVSAVGAGETPDSAPTSPTDSSWTTRVHPEQQNNDGGSGSSVIAAGSTVAAVAQKSATTATVPTGSGSKIVDAVKSGSQTVAGTTTTTAAAGAGDLLKNEFADEATWKPLGFDTGLTGGTAHLVQGVVWVGVAYFAGKMLGSLFGFNAKQSNALGTSLAVGTAAYKLITYAQTQGTGFNPSFLGSKSILGSYPMLTAVAIAAVVFVLLYKSEKRKLVTFTCLPFEPALGGSQCEKCNGDPFRPCSEYRCKALGQACELLNKETPGKEQCTWVSKFDVNSPTITPWNEPLTSDMKYISDTSIRPPALGVKIVPNAGGCVAPFTALKFGITTNEPAQCKIDYNHTTTFDAMQYYFGGSNLYSYNHTQMMRLPAPETLNASEAQEIPLFKNDGTFSLYVRCRDANGNQNVDEYAVSYCVDKSPDTTPPVIENTSILSGSPVQYAIDQVPIQVYTNEPADCKWSSQSKAFEDMENTMSCASQTYEVNSNLQYTCEGNLTSLEDRKDNVYYFRCKDNPGKPDNERNVMVQSYVLLLKGTQPLTILDVSPNRTISGSTSTVKVDLGVTTNAGADEGKAKCFFSPTGERDSFIEMLETDSYTHKQTLDLTSGSYTYSFRCIDDGGNAANATTSFDVFVDNNAPKVTRAYKESDALKFVTDEDAECTYSISSCNFVFAEGIKTLYINPSLKTSHYAEWKTGNTYYVKCMDFYGNQPEPEQCSLIAKPTMEIGKGN